MKIDKKLIISYEDYKNLSIPIKAELSTYNIVGPCSILNDKNKELSHGTWFKDYLSSDITSISNIQEYNEKEGLSLSDDELNLILLQLKEY